MRNSLILGILAGAVASAISAGIWAGVTLATGYQIGWMAIGVGFLVGFAVRAGGQGSSAVFGVVGAVFALLGCLAGNVFAMIGFIASDEAISFFEAVLGFDYALTFELISATFQPMDALFYLLAVYEGFKFSIVSEFE